MKSREEIEERLEDNKKILKIKSTNSKINMKQLRAIKENFILEWVLSD